MAKLTKGQRAALPTSKFAGPNRSFPVNDKAHAEAALMLVNKAKKLTPAEKSEVKAEARKELHRNHPLPRKS
jgi:hypothetical protein